MKRHNTMKVVLLVVTVLWLLSAIFLPDKDWAVLVKMALSLVELFLMLFAFKEKNNALKVVLVTTFVLMVLTWIIPAAYYSGEYLDQGRTQMGLFDLFNYPVSVTIPYFGYLVLFVIVLGGFYGILYKIPAYRSFLDRIVEICKGKEAIALSAIMFILTVLTSAFGMQLALLMFFPMLAAIILLMGYDKIVVALTLVGSTMIGVAGTTYGYSNTGLLNSVLGLDMGDNILVKTVIFLVGLVLLVFNTLMYAKRSNVATKARKIVVKSENTKEEVVKVVEDAVLEKATVSKKTTTKVSGKGNKSSKNANRKSTTKGKTTSKSSRKDIKAAAKDDDVIVVKESLEVDSMDNYVPTVVYSKHKIWPIAVAFILLFVITILAFAPWTTVFGVDAFTKTTEAINEFELFGFPIFAKLLGNYTSFGEWSVTDLIVVMSFVTLLLTFIYKVKADDVFDGLKKGARRALSPAFVVVLVYTCLVLTTYHPFQMAVYKAILGLTKGFNILTTTVVAVLASLFNQDPAYSFQAVVPYFVGLVTKTEVYPVAGILFQSIYGVSMLFVPTSLLLMTVLSYLGISYKEWMKSIWKLLVELFIVLLLVFAILVLV